MSSSPSTGTTSHGGGWFWPALLVYAATVAAVWAIGDFSPWVFIIGTLGTLGAGWLGYHLGHVVGHFFHSEAVEWICRALGAVAAFYLLEPIVEWRDVLTSAELRLYMWAGFGSILFLSIELGHLVHDHGRQAILGIGTFMLLIGLYLGRPDGAEFDTDFVVARPRPVTGSWVTPGPTITQT
ncbi:hypothetical protein EBS80_00525, partial [bacterium]|nr:hypothetical protein [bacterium]